MADTLGAKTCGYDAFGRRASF